MDIKVFRDRFRCVSVVFPYVTKGVLRIGRPVISMFRLCKTFWKECKLCSRWHWLTYRWNDQWSWSIAWVQNIFSTLRMKGHVLHRAHLKVPGWSLVWNALLTKRKSYQCFCRVWMKLMEAAKRLYHYRGHFEVILSFYRMMDFTARLWG